MYLGVGACLTAHFILFVQWYRRCSNGVRREEGEEDGDFLGETETGEEVEVKIERDLVKTKANGVGALILGKGGGWLTQVCLN